MAKKKPADVSGTTKKAAQKMPQWDQGGLRGKPGKMTSGQKKVDRQYRATGVQGGLKPGEMTPGQRSVYDQYRAWNAAGRPKTMPTTPDNPSGSGGQQDTADRTVSTTDIDWALSAAWTDPAQRAGLVKLIEDAIARKDLDAYGDQTVFMGKMWNMLRETAEYKARFPGLVKLEQQAGYNPLTSMTPNDYLKMEGLYDNAMAFYGIPGDVFNRNQMVADLVGNQVTPQEMQQRIQMAADAAAANADITSKLLEYEGVEPGHIIAFYLNPDDAMAAIIRKEQALQIGGMMSRYGFQGAKSDAQQWQQQFGGVNGLSTGGVASSLDRAARRKALMSGLGSTASESELLQGSAGEGAQSQGLDVIAAQRQARFNRSGGAAETQRGVSGLGRASTT